MGDHFDTSGGFEISKFDISKFACIGKIEMVQRKAARMTLDNFHTQASVTEMLTQLGWHSLEQRRNDYRLFLFYKIIYGLVAI